MAFLAQARDLPVDQFRQYLYELTDERACRHVLEAQLGVVGEAREHRLPVAVGDSGVERAHVTLHQLAARHIRLFCSRQVRTAA